MPKNINYNKTQTTVYIDESIKNAAVKGMVDQDGRTNLSKKVEELVAEIYLGAESVEEITSGNFSLK